jgi:hypothetical protein
VDYALSEEPRAIREQVERFAREVLLPGYREREQAEVKVVFARTGSRESAHDRLG